MSDNVIEHTNRCWDTLCIRADFDVLLIGIGVFSPSTGQAEVTISVDARPLIEPLRPLDLTTRLDCVSDDKESLTIFAKVYLTAPKRGFVMEKNIFPPQDMGSDL